MIVVFNFKNYKPLDYLQIDNLSELLLIIETIIKMDTEITDSIRHGHLK